MGSNASGASQPKSSPREIVIQPVTRIEGHARITISLDEKGNANEARVHIMSMRGFEKFLEGRAAEEVPGIVTRICGICPWQHHLASSMAVEGCFGADSPAAGLLLRELTHLLAHINDKVLHFFMMAGPDFLVDTDDNAARSIIGLARQAPELAEKVIRMRHRGQMMLERFTGRSIHPEVIVPGGFSKPMVARERDELHAMAFEQLEFARFALEFAKDRVFSKFTPEMSGLGEITTGFLGMVNPNDGSMNFNEGILRLMRPDGSFQEFSSREYTDFIGEHVEPWSYAKFPYARGWGDGFSMVPEDPRGIYRTNSLARINVCDSIPTPLAQAELLEFRSHFPRPAQSLMLYHWARLIELVYACERALELLEMHGITDPHVRNEVTPRAGRGVGCVEAPRGTLIHDYSTDENGCITRANLIVGTTHNMASINMSVNMAARELIRNGEINDALLNRIEMAVRAYDPCISCATHNLDGGRLFEVSVRDADGKLLVGSF